MWVCVCVCVCVCVRARVITIITVTYTIVEDMTNNQLMEEMDSPAHLSLNNVPSSAESHKYLGGSGGVVNSLDFCLALLKSFLCFYFRCVLSLQWKAVTVNFRILHCQL